jgi:hypothetical protein
MKFTRRMLGAWLAGLPFLKGLKAKPTFLKAGDRLKIRFTGTAPSYRITGYTCIYACGCKASGPTPLPPYCPEHGIVGRLPAAAFGGDGDYPPTASQFAARRHVI